MLNWRLWRVERHRETHIRAVERAPDPKAGNMSAWVTETDFFALETHQADHLLNSFQGQATEFDGAKTIGKQSGSDPERAYRSGSRQSTRGE